MTSLVPITAVYASLLATLVVILVLLVVKLRRGLKIGIGDGGNRDLARAIRVHGNAIESIPLFLVLLAVYELNGGHANLLHIFGAIFLSHASRMHRACSPLPVRLEGVFSARWAPMVACWRWRSPTC